MTAERSVLNDLYLSSRSNLQSTESGIDSLQYCMDKDIFSWWPESIYYRFNSRGFRDDEWPRNLENSIWCFGDSFTVGIGSNYENIWPRILERKIKQRCIKIALDGASNQWISRRVVQVINEVAPKRIVIHWSYAHRRESPNSLMTDEDRRIMSAQIGSMDPISEDLQCWADSVNAILKAAGKTTQIVHSFVPSWSSEPGTRNEYNVLSPGQKTSKILKELDLKLVVPEFKQIDFARDLHHYSTMSATYLADKIIENFGQEKTR